MNKTARAWAAGLLVLAGGMGGTANAAVVTAGSSYSVFIEGEFSGNPLHMTNAFDATPEVFSRAGNDLTVSETEVALGGGLHRLFINVSSTGELFPVAGEGGISGIGIDGNGFDLTGNYFLEDAFIRYYVNGTEEFTSEDLADLYRPYFSGAWTGRFADTDVAFLVGNLGGADVNGYSLDFVVSELPASVPEPGTLALAGCALLAMAAARRRRN